MIFFVYFLIFPSYSKLTTLNSENYKEILDRKGKKPLFLKVWSPWCSHCQSLAPIIFQLSEIQELNSSIEFGELNCDSYPSQCKQIADNKVPTFYYYDSELKEKISYYGDDNIDGFRFFLQKQLNRNLVNITSKEEKDKIISSSDYGIVYIFSIPLNDPALELAINFSKNYKETNKRFFVENNPSITKKSLIAYRSHNYFVEYNGNWSKSSVFDFIFENYFPLIENVGQEVFIFSTYFEKIIVLLGFKDKQTREEINQWNLDPRPDVQYCVENVTQWSVMSYKLVFDINYHDKFIAIIDFKKHVSWKNKSIPFSKKGVDQLINLSLNDKELKFAYGPGNPNNSIFTRIRFFYINKFGLDWFIYVILTFVILVTFILIILLVCQCMSDKKEAMKKQSIRIEKAKKE